MSPRNVGRLAWALVALTLCITLAATTISVVDDSLAPGSDSIIWTISLVFVVGGYFVATRQPRNAIGWMFLGVAVAAAFAQLTGAYADYWTSSGAGPKAIGEASVAYRNVSWIPFILVPATFLLLLFPDGHLLSRRWRPVAWCAGLGVAGGFAAKILEPGPVEDYPAIDNPYGIESGLLEAFDLLTFAALFFGVFGSAISLVVRFRRGRGDQRQQMKWIALAGAVAAVTIPLMFALYEVVGHAIADRSIMLSILALPVATTLAIVRYRLYDIDVVINRALVYGSLTATLAGVYVGSVLLLQLALGGLTEGSGLVVAASTLAVAALFRPVRDRIQGVVDQRFFRRRFDAARTVEVFGARLRDEVDLTALSVDLQEVVAETMQPSHVSLWLRTSDAG